MMEVVSKEVLALISKNDAPQSFEEFIPISLCNTVTK